MPNLIEYLMLHQLIKRLFCDHVESFSFRKYDDFDFREYDQCSKCGKILRYLKGFDEDLRG